MRLAFDALFAIDDAMGDVVAQSTQPALGAIKLAWWRERLEELDKGQVPAEPRLQAAAAKLLPIGIPGTRLGELERGWATLLDEWPQAELIRGRGAKLFEIGGAVLGASAPLLEEAGALFAAVDLARRTGNHGWLNIADQVRDKASFPAALRPLTALATLASRDLKRFRRHGFEQEATPGRAWTLLRHRLTGRI